MPENEPFVPIPDAPVETREAMLAVFEKIDQDELAKDMAEYIGIVGQWAEKVRVKHNLTPYMLHGLLLTGTTPVRAHRIYMEQQSSRDKAGEN